MCYSGMCWMYTKKHPTSSKRIRVCSRPSLVCLCADRLPCTYVVELTRGGGGGCGTQTGLALKKATLRLVILIESKTSSGALLHKCCSVMKWILKKYCYTLVGACNTINTTIDTVLVLFVALLLRVAFCGVNNGRGIILRRIRYG